MKILIVDDQTSMRSLVKGMLHKLGFPEIEEANDGDAALNKLKLDPFDLVITDLHMPKMSGIDFLRETRAISSIKDTLFLMVTTENSKNAVLEAIKYKVNGYIIKPFTIETLKEKLGQLGFQSGQNP